MLDLDHLDVDVSNIGGISAFRPVLNAPADELLGDYKANVLALLGLLQACRPWLKKDDGPDPRRKKFLLVSSTTGSIGIQAMQHFSSTGYRTSKAAGTEWRSLLLDSTS